MTQISKDPPPRMVVKNSWGSRPYLPAKYCGTRSPASVLSPTTRNGSDQPYSLRMSWRQLTQMSPPVGTGGPNCRVNR